MLLHHYFPQNSYNTWNTTPTTGTNIIGGSHLGGNYWSDYAGSDTNDDGLGDTLTPYNSSGNITNGGDYHPLVINETSPVISFISPTPDNGITTANTSIVINVNITEADDLNELNWNWNGTNYTMYNESLVLMYNFDNVSALGENSTHVVDMSFGGNNGAVTNAVFNSSGKYGRTLEFNETGYVIADSVTSHLVNTNFTISAWFKWENAANSPYPTIISFHTDTYVNGMFGLIYEEYDYVFGIYNGTDNQKGTRSLNDANWHYMVIVYNHINGYLNVYIDGVNEISDYSSTLSINASDRFSIGQEWDGTTATDLWNGNIDEVRIWNVSLSADEIYEQYVSNLNKYDTDGWGLYVNQSKNATAGLDSGTYTYQAFVSDIAGNGNATEVRNVTISTETFPCTCGDICVNTSGWWRDGGVFNANATTPIQAAQDNATSGDTICVKDGTYNTSIWISKDRLTFCSENGTANCIISATGDYAFAIAGSTNYVNISGFTVENATKSEWWSAGIIIQGSYCNVSYNLAHDNFFGVNINGGDHNLVSYNNVSYNSQDGIILCNSTNNTITTSTVSNNQRHGIQLNLSNNTNISSNSIKNNIDHGCYLNGTGNSLYCNNISGNGNSDNDYGIYVWSSNSNSIYDNYFDNTHNAYDNGNNIWNIIPTTGTNIINGSHIGGNYWSDYAGADTTGDGLGDILVPYHNSISNGGDYRPLATSGFATPIITSSVPGSSAAADTVGTPRTFSITIDQSVDVIWYINDTQVQTNDSVSIASYTNQNSVAGYWNVTAVVNNTIGHDIRTWWWCGCQRA